MIEPHFLHPKQRQITPHIVLDIIFSRAKTSSKNNSLSHDIINSNVFSLYDLEQETF